jgi:DNA-binding NarL/FixJ family response regulator
MQPSDRPFSTRANLEALVVRFLVVDDEPSFRVLTRMLLEDHPRYVVAGEAADGEEAIGQARALRPDAVLLDLNMPGLNGLQALPRLRAASPSSRIVVVSVARDQHELHQAKMAGAHAFIDKALSNEQFLAALDSCLNGATGWTEHRRDTFGFAADRRGDPR